MFFLVYFWIPLGGLVAILVALAASLTRNRGFRAPLLVAVGAYPILLLAWILTVQPANPFDLLGVDGNDNNFQLCDQYYVTLASDSRSATLYPTNSDLPQLDGVKSLWVGYGSLFGEFGDGFFKVNLKTGQINTFQPESEPGTATKLEPVVSIYERYTRYRPRNPEPFTTLLQFLPPAAVFACLCRWTWRVRQRGTNL